MKFIDIRLQVIDHGETWDVDQKGMVRYKGHYFLLEPKDLQELKFQLFMALPMNGSYMLDGYQQ